jgi:C-terminal processing protease CtpA/Prc
LAISKIYSVLKYFYPNKHLWTHNWDSLYPTFIPRFVLAKDSLEYLKAVVEMYTFLQDGHGGIRQHNTPVPLRTAPGISPPFKMRMVESQLVITAILNDSLARALDIKPGDIILQRDGKNVLEDINENRKYFSASNYDAQTSYITRTYLRKPVNSVVHLKIKDAKGKIKTIALPYINLNEKQIQKATELDTKGNHKPMMYFVNNDIGYVNLAILKPQEVDSMFNLFQATKGLIFDIRSYPLYESIHHIYPRLTPVKYRRWERMLPGNAIVNEYMKHRAKGIYRGKVVGLIHEATQSAGEVVADAIGQYGTLIGDHTAGANGNVVWFYLPGDIRLIFTGANTPMQGQGVQPDIKVKPTIKGIHQGRDELLERAIEFIQKSK